jgi:hypothetical protein
MFVVLRLTLLKWADESRLSTDNQQNNRHIHKLLFLLFV